MNDNSQYLQMFFDEAEEYIQILNENILALEQEPDNTDIINSIFRAAHSLKGMAATMGFDELTDLTHKLENALDKVRNEQLNIDASFIDLLFEGLDLINELVDDIKEKGEEATSVSDYVQRLNNRLKEESGIEVSEENKLNGEFKINLEEKEEKNIKSKMKETDNIYEVQTVLKEDSMLKSVRAYMVLKKTRELGYLAKSKPTQKEIENEQFDRKLWIILVSNLTEEDIIDELSGIRDVDKVIVNIRESAQESDQDTAKENESETEDDNKTTGFEVAPTVRVDINKLDKLMNMVGELLINKTRLEGLNVDSDIYQDIIQQLDRVTMELHHVVMQIRMVPIGGIFNRFPRMVRDLSRDLDKKVDLKIEGADTELDRSIIDELADPLVHILRNAVDHGIEKPEVREEKGKNPTGKILLKAYQKGSEILIEVEDDGAGLDPDKLAQKAVEKGLTTAEEVENMDAREKLNFIFHPGFSTTEKVNDVSGRGVGMDVVKSVVESLDGKVRIDSEKDVGTRFTISLPLTLAITQALMVKIDRETFAIPLSAISETLTIENSDIRQVRGQDVIVLRDKTIPVIEASKQLNLDVEYKKYKNENEIPVVVVNTGDRQVGLIVDELLNQQEIVIKSLGKYLANTRHISGATIVGDGDVALILDVRNIA